MVHGKNHINSVRTSARVSSHAVSLVLTAATAYWLFVCNRTLRARGTVESWLYNVELAMYETVKM